MILVQEIRSFFSGHSSGAMHFLPIRTPWIYFSSSFQPLSRRGHPKYVSWDLSLNHDGHCCPKNSWQAHSAMFKCGGLRYNSTLSKFSWPLCWYSCNFRESEINVRPPELASWPPRVKKDEVLDILAVSECRIIPATCRSWSFFEPMLMIYLAQWDNL